MTVETVLAELSLADEGDTRALGALVASEIREGETVILSGSLGSGKTTFVKGFVQALDADIEVTSPTFALCHRYECSPPVAHVDCWRMKDELELEDLVLDELQEDGWVALVEWGERFSGRFAPPLLHVLLSTERIHRIARLSSSDPRWIGRAEVLNRACREIGEKRC
ncbi:MAG TPA: tRNA (adenosine(37)-N6)-threonylcarbamoyltransferase complex ATPase subunit type 1 TsaE [Acidimicrobiales bacterium]|nr:tRNA (adenosine(37)-N6)-threonylcarbamoyltransferase complex ATPase subunit type 1 TsaE [Acidimicrobiales bacterium]